MNLKIHPLRQIGNTIKIISLGLTGQSFPFRPGQAVALTINAPEHDILNQKRYYSLSSSPLTTTHLELLIKDNATSGVGHYLYNTLKKGQTLEISGPYGNMVLPEKIPASITLIAGGSGIAPLMSILRYLTTTNSSTKISVLYSTKTLKETAYRDELQTLASQAKITYISTLTEESWGGTTGRILRPFLEQHLPTKEGIFFICGPKDMIKDTSQALKDIGVQEQSIIIERY